MHHWRHSCCIQNAFGYTSTTIPINHEIKTSLNELHQGAINTCQCGAASKRHSKLKFRTQQFQYMTYSFCTFCCKPPKNWSSNQDSSRSQGLSFQNISATAYAPVEINLTPSVDCFDG